ncbi:MAG: hypothetical protein ABEL04_05355 [Salinibacter sp.]|uniref:hypothetical protein n=1 Tax=Salinibacter sp. TaxID=2065818 RepID=UPI0035D518D7
MSPDGSAEEELRTLREHLDDIEGIETVFARPGAPREERFRGYVSMRADEQEAARKLLARLGRKFSTVFHVGDQKCEMGFRVEVSLAQNELRYILRFWGCPEWPMHRVRRTLAGRVAGERDRRALPSLEPPGPDRSD